VRGSFTDGKASLITEKIAEDNYIQSTSQIDRSSSSRSSVSGLDIYNTAHTLFLAEQLHAFFIPGHVDKELQEQ